MTDSQVRPGARKRRLGLRDLAPSRVASAVVRRVTDVPHAVAWATGASGASTNKRRIEAFRDRHRGQRCVIMGNGPSLAHMDLTPLANEITFGLNRIYLLFDRITFRPTYHVCINELVLDQFAAEIAGLTMPRFLNWNRRVNFAAADPTIQFVKLRLGLADRFQPILTSPISSGGTVTFVALEIAFFMGFEEVYLIGVDHSFSQAGTPNATRTRTAVGDVDHFHPDYFPSGSRWQLPDLQRSEIAYALARSAYESEGRQILDATVGGHCPVFQRVDYQDTFR